MKKFLLLITATLLTLATFAQATTIGNLPAVTDSCTMNDLLIIEHSGPLFGTKKLSLPQLQSYLNSQPNSISGGLTVGSGGLDVTGGAFFAGGIVITGTTATPNPSRLAIDGGGNVHTDTTTYFTAHQIDSLLAMGPWTDSAGFLFPRNGTDFVGVGITNPSYKFETFGPVLDSAILNGNLLTQSISTNLLGQNISAWSLVFDSAASGNKSIVTFGDETNIGKTAGCFIANTESFAIHAVGNGFTTNGRKESVDIYAQGSNLCIRSDNNVWIGESGGYKITQLNGSAGQILTLDGSANATWETPSLTAAMLTSLYPSLPPYANDAAAGTGGLTTGQPYVNSTTYALTFKQ